MKVILRAQVVTDWSDITEVDVAELSRPARALNADTLRLLLTDGKMLLERLQQLLAHRLTSSANFTECVSPVTVGLSSKIDGGFVRGIGHGECKNFEILTGRLSSPNAKPYVGCRIVTPSLDFAWAVAGERRGGAPANRNALPILLQGDVGVR